MENKKYSVIFMVLVWTAFLLLGAKHLYDYATGPEGFVTIQFKTVDEMTNGSY